MFQRIRGCKEGCAASHVLKVVKFRFTANVLYLKFYRRVSFLADIKILNHLAGLERNSLLCDKHMVVKPTDLRVNTCAIPLYLHVA